MSDTVIDALREEIQVLKATHIEQMCLGLTQRDTIRPRVTAVADILSARGTHVLETLQMLYSKTPCHKLTVGLVGRRLRMDIDLSQYFYELSVLIINGYAEFTNTSYTCLEDRERNRVADALLPAFSPHRVINYVEAPTSISLHHSFPGPCLWELPVELEPRQTRRGFLKWLRAKMF